MKFPFVLAGVSAWLGVALLLTVAGHQVRAQTTGSINPNADRTEPAGKDEPPPGGCMPIGVTASGEIVFPFLCKGFIEQHKAAQRGPAAADEADRKPAAAEEQHSAVDGKPDKAEDRSAAKQPDPVATEAPKPAVDATEVAPKGEQDSSQKPVTADEQESSGDGKPGSVEKKSAAMESSDTTAGLGKPAPEVARPARSPEQERRKSRQGSAGPSGCTRFRTYDPSSGTYTDYSGRRRACRA
jgi:hypothetical protein